MIWLTWQQHRKQALFTLAALAVVAALMIPTGLAMRHTFADLGLPACVRGDAGPTRPSVADCGTALSQFSNRYNTLLLLGPLFMFAPLLVGLFWGAPVVAREVEHGTHRLVWTQGVSRSRWSLVKFGFVGALAALAAAIYGLGMSWWAEPMSAVQSRFSEFMFDMQGLVPIGYTLLAVALGIFAGTLWPRTLPAMAVTLPGFVGLRITLLLLARPHYLPAVSRTVPDPSILVDPNTGTSQVLRPISTGDWQLAREFVYPDGSPILPDAQGNMPFGPGTYIRELYQPADRFWLFQGIETGIYICLTLLLLYLAIRRIRRIA